MGAFGTAATAATAGAAGTDTGGSTAEAAGTAATAAGNTIVVISVTQTACACSAGTTGLALAATIGSHCEAIGYIQLAHGIGGASGRACTASYAIF